MYKRTYMPTETHLDIVTPDGRLLIEEIEVEVKTAGGIILAEKSDPNNTCRLGKIIYNGIKVDGHINDLYNEGNKVYFGKYGGSSINHNGKVYISLLESEISAVTV